MLTSCQEGRAFECWQAARRGGAMHVGKLPGGEGLCMLANRQEGGAMLVGKLPGGEGLCMLASCQGHFCLTDLSMCPTHKSVG